MTSIFMKWIHSLVKEKICCLDIFGGGGGIKIYMAAVGSSIQKCFDTDLCCNIDLLGGQGSDDITVSLSSEHITSCTPVSLLLCSLSDFCLLSACQSVTTWHKEGFFSPLFCETHSFQCGVVHLRANSKIIWMKCRSKKKKFKLLFL